MQNDSVALSTILTILKRLEKGQEALEQGQAQLQGSVAALEKGQEALEQGQAQLQGSVAALEQGQTKILERLDRVEVLLESETDRLDGALEVLSDVAHQTAKIPAIENQITNVASDSQVIKKAVTETNRDLREFDERLTVLEVRA